MSKRTWVEVVAAASITVAAVFGMFAAQEKVDDAYKQGVVTGEVTKKADLKTQFERGMNAGLAYLQFCTKAATE